MANKDWFARKSLTLRSESIFFKTRDLNSISVNGSRILTSDDIGNQNVVVWTPTIESGGVINDLPIPTVTLTYQKIGNSIVCTFEMSDAIQNVSGTSFIVMRLNGIATLPTELQIDEEVDFTVPITDGGSLAFGLLRFRKPFASPHIIQLWAFPDTGGIGLQTPFGFYPSDRRVSVTRPSF